MISDLKKYHLSQTMVSSDRYVGHLWIPWINCNNRFKVTLTVQKCKHSCCLITMENFYTCFEWKTVFWMCQVISFVHYLSDFELISTVMCHGVCWGIESNMTITNSLLCFIHMYHTQYFSKNLITHNHRVTHVQVVEKKRGHRSVIDENTNNHS